MTNSTSLITDMGTAITTATASPNAVSTAAAIAAGGPIQDLPGMLRLAQLKLQEAKDILARLRAVSPYTVKVIADADAISAGVDSVINVLN